MNMRELARNFLTIALTVVGFGLLQSMLAVTTEVYEHEAITINLSQDLCIGMGVMLLLARLKVHRSVALLFALSWLSIVLFDAVRDIGAVTMGQDPLIYDAVLLTAHLLVLLRDTLGKDTTRLLWIAGGGLAGAFVLTWGLFYWLMGRYRKAHWGVVLTGISLLLGITWWTTTEDSPWPSRLSTPDLVENGSRSFSVWSRLQEGLSGEAYSEAAALQFSTRPDVHIYIIESYGQIMTRKSVRKAWKKRLSSMNRALRAEGWFMATGLSHAPVAGGRSWLADATLFAGIEVKYESVYRHLVPRAAEVPSLVRMFEGNDYRTLLVRPKDKARRGVKLVNHFAFDDTVFFDDLKYSGISYGWAGIPDQYTLGKLRDEILPESGEDPTFLFFHMASSHIPWDELPPVVDDWRVLGGEAGQGVTSPRGRFRTKSKEIEFQLARYKRSDEVRINRLRATTQNLEQYAKAIDYELEILQQHLLALPDRPSLIILMGDHQPPMLGKSKNFSVPVHVLTRGTRLRREFLERGFKKGLQVQDRQPVVRHEGLFSVIARALAFNDGSEMPPYLPNGAVQGDAPKKGELKVVTDKVAK